MNDDFDFNKGRTFVIAKLIIVVVFIAFWGIATYVMSKSLTDSVYTWFKTPIKTLPFDN